MNPTDAVLAVTYRCNARCSMCGIWQSEPGPELQPATYRKLPPTLRDINLTGGEPFLRNDLPALHQATRHACPNARTVVSTNGLLTDRIVEHVREMTQAEPAIGVAVSIDGPARVHDRIRGTRGAFDKATRTIRELQSSGFTNLRIAFTATRTSLPHLRETYSLARDLGVQFTCAIEHGSSHYFHAPPPEAPLPRDELRRQLAPVIREALHSLSPKRWGRAYFMNGLWQFATGRGRPLPCRAGRDFFFMAPSGDIYTCNAAPLVMGNLAEQDFDQLWRSPAAAQSREKAARCGAGCWMICTARTAMRRARLRVLAWALLHRIVPLPIERPRS